MAPRFEIEPNTEIGFEPAAAGDDLAWIMLPLEETAGKAVTLIDADGFQLECPDCKGVIGPSNHWVTLDGQYGDPIDLSTRTLVNDFGEILFKKRNEQAHFNVFFVWSFRGPDGYDLAYTWPPAATHAWRVCVMRGNIGDKEPACLAHETCHFLNINREDDDSKNLMFLGSDFGGLRIPKKDALAINDFAHNRI